MTDIVPDTRSSNTWMLFESGEAAKVDLTVYCSPKGGSRPIDAYFVTEAEGDFTNSARRAAESVYHEARRFFSGEESVVVGYDLGGLPGGCRLEGESGGLAFAIALAKKKFEQNPGPVAATGVITSSSNGGPVGRVKGIEDKLKAAIRVLPEDGWVLCPKENKKDITESLIKTFKDKGLKLELVGSVSEALRILFSPPKPLLETDLHPIRRSKFLVAGIVSIFLCAAIAAGFWASTRKSIDRTAQSDPVSVELVGETFLTENLAKKLTAKLIEHFRQPGIGGVRYKNLSGKVAMVRITEEMMNNGEQLQSQMTVKLVGLKIERGDGLQPYPTFQVHVKGVGPASSLVSKAAETLYNEITGAVRIEKKKGEVIPPPEVKPSGAKGFE